MERVMEHKNLMLTVASYNDAAVASEPGDNAAVKNAVHKAPDQITDAIGS
jgi:hypothetical protein